MDTRNINTQIRDYLVHCQYEKNLNLKTLKTYEMDLRQFVNFIGAESCVYSKEVLQLYIAHLQSNYKIKSVKRKIASLKAFFNYLEYEELLETNPFSKMRIKLQEPFLLPRTIPLAVVDKLLHCAYQKKSADIGRNAQYRSDLRDIAVLELLFATGMRVSELCSLKPEFVDLTEGTVKIYGKGAKERIIHIGNENVLSAVNAYYNAFSDNIASAGWFFVNRLGHQLSDQSVRFMIRKYTDLAGSDLHITPHMFRHAFATLLLEEDVDIRYIQQLLGHSSIVTTQIYTHVASKKQRDILIAKHPRNKINP